MIAANRTRSALPTDATDTELVDPAEVARLIDGLDLGDEGKAKLLFALRRIVEFACDGLQRHEGSETLIARRAIALAWVMNPAIFDGMSLAELGRTIGLCNRNTMSSYASEASRLFGIANHAQSHGWNRGIGAPEPNRAKEQEQPNFKRPRRKSPIWKMKAPPIAAEHAAEIEFQTSEEDQEETNEQGTKGGAL